MNDITNKVIWVTGAGKGIGAAIANELMQSGAIVIASGRSTLDSYLEKNELDKDIVVSERFHYLQCDVTNSEQVHNAADYIKANFGALDVLINNAGLGEFAEFIELKISSIRSMMEVNFFGAVNCINAVLEDMISKKDGIILNILSVAVHESFPYSSAYAASKAALYALSKSIRTETRNMGIKIINVHPGATKTEIWAKDMIDEHGYRMMKSKDIAEVISSVLKVSNKDVMPEELIIRPQLGNI